MSKATAIYGHGMWRCIPAFRAWLVLTVVLAAAVSVLIFLMLSREPEETFGHAPDPPAPAASDSWLAEAEMLKFQAEATARDLRDVLRSVAAYECPSGTVAHGSDRFEAITQRAAGAVRSM